MSNKSCEVGLNTIECEHPSVDDADAYPSCRSRCYACGQPACKKCSKVQRWAGGRHRVCNDCVGVYQ